MTKTGVGEQSLIPLQGAFMPGEHNKHVRVHKRREKEIQFRLKELLDDRQARAGFRGASAIPKNRQAFLITRS